MSQPDSLTPICWASSHGRVEMVKLLIAAGADVNKGVVIKTHIYIQHTLLFCIIYS
jgi:ankyrin repeat protein